MNARVLYFAKLREQVGKSEENLVLAEAAPTVAAVLRMLRARGGVWESAFSPENAIKFAVDRQFASADTPLSEGAEVALFPPMTGG